jgi:hypothetical protein
MQMIVLAAAVCVAFAYSEARAEGAWCIPDSDGCTNCANACAMCGQGYRNRRILRAQCELLGIRRGTRTQAAQQLATCCGFSRDTAWRRAGVADPMLRMLSPFLAPAATVHHST